MDTASERTSLGLGLCADIVVMEEEVLFVGLGVVEERLLPALAVDLPDILFLLVLLVLLVLFCLARERYL